MPTVLGLAISLLTLTLLLSPLAPPLDAAPGPIRRAVVLVLDQCRADYPDRYQMTHVKSLAARGTSFSAARVGHLPSETIISHPVLGRGVFPRSLPWADEVFPDLAGDLGPAGELHLSASLDLEDGARLLGRYPGGESLVSLLKKRLGGGVYVVGSKNYAFGPSPARRPTR